jgi:DHA2 family methylenomycin A resistance protein-like MFS transporter
VNATATVSSAPGVRHSRAALFAAATGFFVITLDAVVVNVALREISLDLGATITGLQWIVDGYTLLFASCLLSAGAFSDRIGARRAYAIGMPHSS